MVRPGQSLFCVKADAVYIDIYDSRSNAKHYLSQLEVKEPTLQLCQYESQSKLEH